MARIDIAFEQDRDGLYDIAIGDNGDLITVSTIETAIDMSINLDARADASEVAQAQLRRGWFGDVISDNQSHTTGSKLWLFDQDRIKQTTPDLAIEFARKSLEWIESRNIGRIVSITSEIKDQDTMILNIKVRAKDDSIISRYYELWR